MGQIAGAAYNMGVGLGLADYQYSVAQIDPGNEALRAAKAWWKIFAAATGQDTTLAANPINLSEDEALADHHGDHAAMVRAMIAYLSAKLPPTGHPWHEMGVWMGIAEGQSTSPEVSSRDVTEPLRVIQDCGMKILDAIKHVPGLANQLDTLDLSALVERMGGIEPTILHGNLQMIRTNWSDLITDWAGSM